MSAPVIDRACRRRLAVLFFGLTLFACFETASEAQLDVRPNDPLGFSIRVPRVQVVHSEDASRPGTSMYLQQADPWLGYEMGRAFFQRQWTARDGVFSVPTRPAATGTASSCAMCHNNPFRSAGAGGTVADPPGFGLNTPHLFGIGLLESVAIQVRQQILAAHDVNGNGFLDVPAETRGARAVVEAAPGVKVDFGPLEDLNGDGWPGLNSVVNVTFVDGAGNPKGPRSDGSPARLGDPGVAGYDFTVNFLSWTNTDAQMSTVRPFATGVIQSVFGMPVADGTISNDSGTGRDRRQGDGWAEVSNAGAPQSHFRVAEKKCGGPCLPISEGEIDLLEWFLLNHPAPAVALQTGDTRRGRRLLQTLGCTSCHVPDWLILPADEKVGLPGDRRFFDLEVSAGPGDGELRGRLHRLVRAVNNPGGLQTFVPLRGGFRVRNVFTDLRHHDLGERFYKYGYANGRATVHKEFRTPPLWGVGSTAPYGHDGRSQSLDDVIRRHGGEAERSAAAYASAPPRDRRAVVEFLQSLILYQPDALPTDIDGDGVIAGSFRVSGREVGPERFWPELLFHVPPLYRGWTNAGGGDPFFSLELLNVHEAYGRGLDALRDADGDGVPDTLGRKPR